MNIMKKISAVIVLLQFSAVLYARSGYEVELIIFEDTSSRYIMSEDWSYNDNLNNIRKEDTAIAKSDKTEYKDPEYKTLTWDSANLVKDLEKIKENPNFNVIISKRWKQTGLDRDQSFNIHLDSRLNTVAVNTSNSTEQITENTTLTPYITGDVKLIMSRYLHFNVNLQYFKPKADETGNYVYKSFPVVSERRMKSKEVHYIDHPMVGIIMLATPYKIKSDEPQIKPSTYKTL